MDTQAYTIEDLLEILAGLKQASAIQIEPSDATIMHSIARQVHRGTALTDRQYALMKEKLQAYRDQYLALEYNFDLAVETLRKPLRQIDRAKYIKIVDYVDGIGANKVYESWKQDLKLIKVRFPFSKKLIAEIQSFKISPSEHFHEKSSHEHFYVLTEKNCYEIVKSLKDKNFEIDSELLEYYDKVIKFENVEEYAGSIINYEFKNISQRAADAAINELGNPSPENIVKYKDRSKIFGIHYFDDNLDTELTKVSILTSKIANRKSKVVYVSSKEWTFDSIVNSLIELDRFPAVLLINENNPFDDLVKTHKHFKNIVDSSNISVQLRLPSDQSNGFNEYIKSSGLNSPVDNNTKIVYTSREKLNKPLLSSGCKPKVLILMQSQRLHSKMQHWAEEFDLVIHFDKEISQYLNYETPRIERL